MNSPTLDVDKSINFSIVEEKLGIENMLNFYKADWGDTILEIKIKDLSTGKLVYMDFMKVIGNKVSWHTNALQEIDPKISLSTRLKIEKILKNRAFL